ncbi:MAG: hypothetical protein KTR28_09415 [Micavibrio sp.]|nr:hypothetical protein [Micavibrio sp.]
MLNQFKNAVQSSKLGAVNTMAALSLFTALSFSTAADAANDSKECMPLYVNPNGVEVTAGATASYYSRQSPYVVGISASPGRSVGVGDVPKVLMSVLEDLNVKADCYVDKYISDSGQPEYSFHVGGRRYVHENSGKELFRLHELQIDKTILQGVIDSARNLQMAAQDLTNNDLIHRPDL